MCIRDRSNWGNSSQQSKLAQDLRNAVVRLKQARVAANIQPVLGICYGKTRTTYTKTGYLKVVGQNFWYMIKMCIRDRKRAVPLRSKEEKTEKEVEVMTSPESLKIPGLLGAMIGCFTALLIRYKAFQFKRRLVATVNVFDERIGRSFGNPEAADRIACVQRDHPGIVGASGNRDLFVANDADRHTVELTDNGEERIQLRGIAAGKGQRAHDHWQCGRFTHVAGNLSLIPV